MHQRIAAGPPYGIVSETPRPRRTWRRRALFTVLLLFVLLLFVCAYVGLFNGNVRVVVPGKVYRSAQLTGHSFQARTANWAGNDLKDVLTSLHIQSVINLRGGSDRDDWYRAETQVCQQLGVAHVDIALSAVRPPPPDQLHKLIQAFDTVRYPMLFHCAGGADRSGLTGTLYLTLKEHVPLDVAEASQLTWRYGHLNWTSTRAMDNFFALYRQKGQGMNLRDWIEHVYPRLYDAFPASEKSQPADVSNWHPAQQLSPLPKQ